jgi:hypothetical protein
MGHTVPVKIASTEVDSGGDDGVMTGAVTTTATPLLPGAIPAASGRAIRLQVLNGCGVKGLARLISPGLRAKGFDVRETRNASRFDFAYTSIMDRTGDSAMALTLADSLGIDRSRVSTEYSKNLVDIDVTLLVGKDYESLRLNLNRSAKE